MTIEYFHANPPLKLSDDRMWLQEVQSVIEFCQGPGADIGAGRRTLRPDTIRVDVSPETKPDHVATATHLPFADGELDFIFSGHTIEHVLEPQQALREWLRCVRVGGHVCVVVPDTRFTGGQNTDPTPHLHEWGPREFLTDVLGYELGMHTCWWEVPTPFGWENADVIQIGEACPRWSFQICMRKRG